MTLYRADLGWNALYKAYETLECFEDVTGNDILELKEVIGKVADTIGPHLDRIRITFPQYTEHDFRHLLSMADIIHRFLPKESEDGCGDVISLNAVELTYLWLAILLHDTGMFVSDADKKQAILDSKDYKAFERRSLDRIEAAQKAGDAGLTVKARMIRDAIFAEFIRGMHAKRVHAYIDNNLKGLLTFRGADMSEDIGKLCESHAWGVNESNDPRRPWDCA